MLDQSKDLNIDLLPPCCVSSNTAPWKKEFFSYQLVCIWQFLRYYRAKRKERRLDTTRIGPRQRSAPRTCHTRKRQTQGQQELLEIEARWGKSLVIGYGSWKIEKGRVWSHTNDTYDVSLIVSFILRCPAFSTPVGPKRPQASILQEWPQKQLPCLNKSVWPSWWFSGTEVNTL